MSSERRIARHTGWLLAGHVLMTVMLLTQAIILTRTLGAAGYGVLVLVMTYVVTLRELLDSRVWEPILKFVPQFQAEDRDDRAGGVVLFCWLLQAATAVVTLAIVWVTADLAATLLTGDAEVGGAIRLYAISVLLAVPIHPASALARLADRPAWLSGQRVAVVAAQLVATIVAVAVGPTLHLLVVAQLAGAGVGAILAMVMTVAASRQLSLTVRTSDLRALAGRYRTLIRFCVMTNLTGCSRVIAGRADVLLLGWLGSAAQVGVYDIARNLTTQLRELFGPLHMSIMPEMSVVAAEGRLETLRRLRRRLTIVMTAIAVPLCVRCCSCRSCSGTCCGCPRSGSPAICSSRVASER
jgi:O-antigen/teichoic acid export membrane protein